MTTFSRPVASHLSNELGISISLINSMKEFHDTNAQICMLENIRFFDGESKILIRLQGKLVHISTYMFSMHLELRTESKPLLMEQSK